MLTFQIVPWKITMKISGWNLEVLYFLRLTRKVLTYFAMLMFPYPRYVMSLPYFLLNSIRGKYFFWHLQMGKLLEGFKILCSDFDHVLEKRGDIIQGRIRYLSLFGKCERLLLKINPPTTTNRPYFQFQGDRIGCPYICRWKKKSHLIKNIAHRKRCNRISLLRKHEGTCFSSKLLSKKPYNRKLITLFWPPCKGTYINDVQWF